MRNTKRWQQLRRRMRALARDRARRVPVPGMVYMQNADGTLFPLGPCPDFKVTIETEPYTPPPGADGMRRFTVPLLRTAP